MSGLYAIVSIVSVTAGLYEPGDWLHRRSMFTWCGNDGGYVLTALFIFHPTLTKPDSRVWY